MSVGMTVCSHQLRERMVYRETVDNDMQNENDNKIRVKGAALVTCLQEGSHDSVA